VPGKPRVFLPYVGGIAAFRRVCDAVLDRDLDGFVKHPLDSNGASQLAEA
jgi:cyclohexanone monooxygenase